MASAVISVEFADLSQEEKARFLCRLGTRLTILARQLCVEQELTIYAMQQARCLNEMCHKLFGQLGHLIADGQGYPDDVFVASLRSLAAENGLAAEFSDAWDWTAASLTAAH
jgi:hypothetical protein